MCVIRSHCAPAADMIVVSEMGEQWSPQTAPARQAEIPTKNSGSVLGNTAIVIGINKPKVPHAVPVEKESPQAIRKITVGRSRVRPGAVSPIAAAMKSLA